MESNPTADTCSPSDLFVPADDSGESSQKISDSRTDMCKRVAFSFVDTTGSTFIVWTLEERSFGIFHVGTISAVYVS